MEAAVLITDKVTQRLSELGLDEDILVQAVQRGFAERAKCTANHPIMAPGFYAWAETVVALREGLLLRGWRRNDDNAFPLVVNKAGSIAIAVASGNEGTGLPDGAVGTRSSKGPRTVDAVAANQLLLFPTFDEASMASAVDTSTCRTYWLLMYFDRQAGELRCELSSGIEMGADSRIDRFGERLLLRSTSVDADDINVPELPQSQMPEIKVEIRRKL